MRSLSLLKSRFILVVAILATLVLVAGCATPRTTGSLYPTNQPPIWDVCFSPKGSCTDLIVNTLGQAKATVHVQAYSFTSKPIAQALADARGRGVVVETILDKGQRTEDDTQAGLLVQAGIPVRIDAKHSIAHNKVMIIDDETVITGSFNFTQNAEERNAENLLVIRDKTLAAKYEANWQKHWAHSVDFN